MAEEIAGHRPPHSLDAEKSVLGAMLLDQELAVESLDALNTTDFFDRKHRLIFQACRELDSRNSVIDMVTVSEELSRRKNLDEAGGIDYLATLTDDIG
jgi:replicative DNA helicase